MAQTEPIELPDTRMSLQEIIAEIEKQTHFRFAYDPARVLADRVVNSGSSGLPLKKLLQMIETETGYTLSVRNRYVLIDPTRNPVAETQIPHPPKSNTAATGDVYVPNSIALVDKASRPRPASVTDTVPRSFPETESQPSGQSHPVMHLPPFYSDTVSLLTLIPRRGRLPLISVKTDLMYGSVSLTPNIAAEIGLADRRSLEVSGSYNPWKRKASLKDNKKRLHWTIRPEYRFWLCERFNGHFIGVHAFYSRYNISEQQVPLLFDRKYRYDGYAVGAGFTYGYHLPLAKNWGFEFAVAFGGAYLNYDRYSCRLCSRTKTPASKGWFGPTRASVNLIYLIH